MLEKNSSVISHIRREIKRKSLFNSILVKPSLALKGLPGSLKALFLALWIQEKKSPMLIVLPEQDLAETVFDELISLVGESVSYLPVGDIDKESPVLVNPRRMGLQMMVVRDLLFNNFQAIVTSSEGLAHCFPSPDEVKRESICLSAGSRFSIHNLLEKLITFGYSREHLVERPGEVSLRGGILDIFPLTGEAPHRLEFYGEEIESMRIFDISSQKSEQTAQSLYLVSSPLAWTSPSTSILSYFSKPPVIFLEDPDLIFAAIDRAREMDRGTLLDSIILEQMIASFTAISYHTLSSPKGIIDFGGRGLKKLGKSPSDIRKRLIQLSSDKNKIYLVCERKESKERLLDLLNLIEEPIPNVQIELNLLYQGFIMPEAGVMVYTEHDLFGRVATRRRRRKFRESVPIRELSALKKGDFVVHIDHGIGIYQGLEKIRVQQNERECLAILYQEGDKLFVPVDKMERVQKYAARDSARPVLSKLGTQQWEKLKVRTKRSIQNIAKDLIVLYSARQSLPGYAFSPDTAWQKDMEASFIYDETEDQERSISEVKRDMENPTPMDRLICGDVGYGKTEVAIRAAFKTVNDGKQVAILVPTTILAQQHFYTFRERLERFPVNIEMLSRFRNSREQQEVIDRLKTGDVDVVIGTHRLLSKDVNFKDIGLLIIDEEHRFGVRHKEKLKAYRKTVDVLAMTATPIPRTLHFSMMKIRDMSLMVTPPKDRLSIITEVCPFDEAIIIEAIERELARGGQIFFVHNRVRSIYAVARMVQHLVPGLRLGVAHGQMPERDLEKVMVDFLEGKYDCLVATMIIESGLDMPHVNTLIIHRADRFGLAQLYQLRGRVGRSNRRAYAYLLTPPFHTLTPAAMKRLRTIEEFTELGSGFQIAMRDLEIRGAGNLLGTQQSGYMDAVGYDLYKRLVEEAVNELQDEAPDQASENVNPVECKVDVDMAAYFSSDYVEDESLRVNLYRRLSSLEDINQIDGFEGEMKDRFGLLPREAETLLDVARLRILGEKRGLQRIIVEAHQLQIWFDDTWIEQFDSSELFNEHLRIIMELLPEQLQFLQDKYFGFKVPVFNEEPIAYTKKLLQSWG